MIPAIHADTRGRWEYWGQGRPDVSGSLDSAGTAWVGAASAGAVFHSTDAPQGAQQWTKTSAGWVVTVGDTGWRLVDSQASAESLTIDVYLRREGMRTCSRFHLYGSYAVIPAANGNFFLPVGFRPGGYVPLYDTSFWAGPIYSHWGQGSPQAMGQAGWLLHKNGSYWPWRIVPTDTTHGVNEVFVELSATCDSPWPTTLPGTPA